MIGKGSFSNIVATEDEKYVIKISSAKDSKSVRAFQKERKAYKALGKHVNIVTCYHDFEG